MIFIGLMILVHITWSSARQPGCDARGPVCGNDGKTYKTMCQLIWARFEDSDLAVLHDGSCNGKYASAILQPSSGNPNDGSGSGKMLLKLVQKDKKKSNGHHDKIRKVMPVGWPPLGPMILPLAKQVVMP